MASALSFETRAASSLLEAVYDLLDCSFNGGNAPCAADPIQAAYAHHFEEPGAGARSQLTLGASAALSITEEDARCLAAAVECLHNASLVQDDLQDQSPVRRGRESVFSKFGDAVALGLTNRLIMTAFVCLSEISEPLMLPDLIRRINQAVAETILGQTTELCENFEACSLDVQLLAARRKSGPLFALALELPLILARYPEFLDTASKAASSFGLGYQIFDDLQDQDADAATGGKGNLVSLMKSGPSDRSSEQWMIGLARKLLKETAEEAEKLPQDAGAPLVQLGDSLSLQIDAYSS